MDRADQKILDELNQAVPHERECEVCHNKWQIEQADIDLLKKLVVPLPTECPECNFKWRLSHRNERNFYKRKCDATGKEIVTVYSPDKPYKVYDKDYWHSDAWDPMEFGQDYDPGRNFFEQFNELMLKVPYPNLFYINCENSDYVNNSGYCRNCYMLTVSPYNENCYYGKQVNYGRECVDCLKIMHCESCYENIYVANCNNCYFLYNSQDCFDCHFSENLTGCKNCILSFNLKNKQYYIRNKPVKKEEFEEFKRSWNWPKVKQEFLEERQKIVVKYADIVNSTNCSGHNIANSRDCYQCFGVDSHENCRHCQDEQKEMKDGYYSYSSGYNSQLFYNVVGAALGSYQIVCSNTIYEGSQNVSYSYLCWSSKNLFGCVGLKQKQYCILNKQYQREEYEKLVEKIKLDMLSRGEYGQFFPKQQSHYGYNESSAWDYQPLTKEEAVKQGFKWSDYEAESAYAGPWYEPLDIKEYFEESRANELLAGVLKCEATNKPFRITGPELAFYLKHQIPIPHRSPGQRHMDRMGRRNPFRLYKRQCMCEGQGSSGGCAHDGKCTNVFETTYAPERPEKVYCEECYQKEVM
ncbi:MAG: hypothetical protein WC570_03810 [Patescibacteria group bacterium]